MSFFRFKIVNDGAESAKSGFGFTNFALRITIRDLRIAIPDFRIAIPVSGIAIP